MVLSNPLPTANYPEIVLNDLVDGVYITDRDRRIIYWSPSAERITGWKAEEVVGRCCREQLLCHIDKDGHSLCGEEHCPLHRSMVTGGATTVPMIIFGKGKDGQRIPMNVSVKPLRSDSGEIIGAIEFFRDMGPRMFDLERARRMQQAMLVEELPTDPRIHVQVSYTPHDVVGGDFYSMKSIDSDRVVIFQADAMGHGVAAALYTVFFRLLWVEFEELLPSPARFLEAVNERMHPMIKDGDTFATAMVAVIDLAQGCIRLAGAGHPSPILFHPGKTADLLDCSGIPLGILPGGKYSESVVSFEPGDRLLVYTDGATEIEDKEGAELGAPGLMKLVEALSRDSHHLPLQRLEKSLLRFSNAIRLDDDINIIWLARLE